MGAPYAERLLPLPGFLTGGDAAPGGEQIAEGFRLTGYFLTRDILTGKLADICETRERLIERLARAGRAAAAFQAGRRAANISEERRVGKGGVNTCSTRWSPYH